MQTSHLALICAACMSLSAGLVYAATPVGGFVSRAEPEEALDAEPEEPQRTRTREPGASPTSTAELVALAPTSVARATPAFDAAPPRAEATARVRDPAWATQTARPHAELWAAPPKPTAPQRFAFASSKRPPVDLDAFAPPQPPPVQQEQQVQRMVSTSAPPPPPPQMPVGTAMPSSTSRRSSSFQ